jgi:lyso-ornithine lipid O-acyltransferase
MATAALLPPPAAEVEEVAPWRGAGLARASLRVAALAATAAVTAARSSRLRRRGGRTRDRVRLLRDGARAVLRHHGIAVDAAGPLPTGACLLACNHVSWIDPMIVIAQVPCAPISKADVRGWPVIGPIVGGLGVIFHARGEQGSGLRVMREAEATLAAGVPVLNFPEGTTTDGRGVLQFRKGLFGLAERLGVPVVPVAIRYLPAELCWIGDDAFVPHYLRLASRRGSRAVIRFGEPVLPGPEGAVALAREVRERVLGLLASA